MVEPTAKRAPEVALRRLTALARDAGSVGRTNRALAQGRERLIMAIERKKLPLSRPPWWLVPAAAAPLLAILGVVLSRPEAPLGYQIEDAPPTEGDVRAGPSGATARFSEGTMIDFAPGARGHIGAVTAHGARVSLAEGGAHFRVTHLPGAEWTAEAGPFTVTVTGTEFDLSWQRERLDVAMQSGSVVVRGPLASGGVTLRDGQHLVADVGRGELIIAKLPAQAESPDVKAPEPDGGAPPRVEAPPTSLDPAPAAPPVPGSAAIAVRTAAPAPSQDVTYRKRVARGDFTGVIADAEARGLDAAIGASPLPDLAALADAARYAGRSDLARQALVAVRSRFPGSAEASSAAFLLGRMAEASSSTAAIFWYDQYLAESPDGSLAAETLGRKMLVARTSGGRPAARPVAEQYLERYPQGTFAAAAAQILAEP